MRDGILIEVPSDDENVVDVEGEAEESKRSGGGKEGGIRRHGGGGGPNE